MANKKEDGSVNSLGVIPNGRLVKKKIKGKDMKKPITVAGRLLAELGIKLESDSSKYDAKLCLKGAFDANKLPELKNAIIGALGSAVEVKYDNVANCFYVDGTEEAVLKVIEVMKSLGIEVEKEQAVASSPVQGPVATPPPAESIDAEAGDEQQDISNDDDGLSDDDKEILKNGRFADVMMRIQMKIERKPVSQQAEYWRLLALDLARVGETKAALQLFAAAKDFLKTQF